MASSSSSLAAGSVGMGSTGSEGSAGAPVEQGQTQPPPAPQPVQAGLSGEALGLPGMGDFRFPEDFAVDGAWASAAAAAGFDPFTAYQ